MKIKQIALLSTILLGSLTNLSVSAETITSSDPTPSSTSSTSSSTSSSDSSTPVDSTPSSSSATTVLETPKDSTTLSETPTEEQTPEIPVDPNNQPMGYFANSLKADGTLSEDNQDNLVQQRNTILRATVSSPSDLKSDDKTLPRKDAVDIASYQSWMTQADFKTLKAAGVKTIVIKLTQNTNYTNPYAKSQIQMARTAGLNIAVYHYAALTGANSQTAGNNQAIKEANYFASVATKLGLPTNTVMVMDCEQPYKDPNGKIIGPNPNTVDWATAASKFASALKSKGYADTKFYTSASWIGTNTATVQMNYNTLGGAKKMWAAQYLYGKPSASNLQNTQYGAWQYTSQMYFVNASSQKPVDTSIDYSNFFTPKAGSVTTKSVYRLYNSRNKEHLYTTDAYEKSQLPKVSKDWKYEGVAWQAPTSSSTAVYRVYNPKSGEHIYTKDSYEIKVLSSKYDWRKEGTAFYSGGSRPVYRLFNAAAGVGAHFITLDSYEKTVLTTKHGWKYEGIAWYGK